MSHAAEPAFLALNAGICREIMDLLWHQTMRLDVTNGTPLLSFVLKCAIVGRLQLRPVRTLCRPDRVRASGEPIDYGEADHRALAERFAPGRKQRNDEES